jgi:hypothetical protein
LTAGHLGSLIAALGDMTETSSLRRFWYTIALKPTGHESTIHSHDTNITADRFTSPCLPLRSQCHHLFACEATDHESTIHSHDTNITADRFPSPCLPLRSQCHHLFACEATDHESTIHSHDTNITSLSFPSSVFASPNLDAIFCLPALHSRDCRLTLPRQV